MEIKFINQISGANLILLMASKDIPEHMEARDKLARIIEAQAFEAKEGQILHILGFESYENIWLIGVAGAKNYITIGAQITKALIGRNISQLCLYALELDKNQISDVLAGIMLRDYVFDKYKKFDAKKRFNVELINIVADHVLSDEQIDALKFEAQCVKMSRDVINQAPCCIYPKSLATHYKEFLEPLGVKVDILKGDQIKDMGLLLAVGKASVHEPCVVVMEWEGSADKPIALLGKGVTYDSGGLSLKPSSSMERMKSDMSGSAIVAAVIANAAKNKYKKNIIGVVGLVENMVAGNSYKPDDVITSRSGKTVEIINTDAEGRLVLADIIDYVQDKYAPSHIVDLATLTGAIVVALGHVYGGLFSNNDDLAAQLMEHGKRTHEKLWRMPLDKVFTEAMYSQIADLKHFASGSVGAGSSTAAAFLGEFIKNDIAWAHLDIAGVSFSDTQDFASPAGATGFGVRLLSSWLKA